jgi:hypothetical protein
MSSPPKIRSGDRSCGARGWRTDVFLDVDFFDCVFVLVHHAWSGRRHLFADVSHLFQRLGRRRTSGCIRSSALSSLLLHKGMKEAYSCVWEAVSHFLPQSFCPDSTVAAAHLGCDRVDRSGRFVLVPAPRWGISAEIGRGERLAACEYANDHKSASRRCARKPDARCVSVVSRGRECCLAVGRPDDGTETTSSSASNFRLTSYRQPNGVRA